MIHSWVLLRVSEEEPLLYVQDNESVMALTFPTKPKQLGGKDHMM